jgi:hypothetical protein
MRITAPGGVATYTLGVQSIGGFTATVTLVAASPSPSLTVYLNPAALTPPGQATLSITDSHPGPTLLPGVWYTVPITASGGSITQSTGVRLLVGGARIRLPILLKN